MAERFQAPRGTHDILPVDANDWQEMEDCFASIAAKYGYSEIRTPMFEPTDLFVRSSGETSEVVSKQMYTFEDKGGRSMTLKPEGTAPVIRAYLEHSLGQQGQVSRLWYQTPIFRYERPQKGRYRQSHQFGLELIGSSSPAADAEIIEMTVLFYKNFAIDGLRVLINCIGRADARSNYAQAILDHVSAWLQDQDSEQQERARKNPLRLLDSKDSSIIEAVSGVAPITQFLNTESRSHFDQVQQLLTEADVSFELRPEIVRGLDYYTDTVFEVQSEGLGSHNALCGGGRYDGLVKQIGGPDTPAVGVAMGVERAIMVRKELGVPACKRFPEVYLVAVTASALQPLLEIGRKIREEGTVVIAPLGFESMKKQMKLAAKSEALHAVILGEEEMASNTVTFRHMRRGTQHSMTVNEVIEYFRGED